MIPLMVCHNRIKKRSILRANFFPVILSLLILFLNKPIYATESQQPLWEVGVFSAVARIPHYPGSDEYRTYAVPFPYVIYRGEILQADREGVKGIFYKDRHIETNISLFGNPPVQSDNEARDKMPELDGLFEAGPSLKYYFNGRKSTDPLFLKLSIRAASSVNFDNGIGFEYQGLRYATQLFHTNTTLLTPYISGFTVSAGVDFASQELNRYFYDVERAYVTPKRSRFQSDGGYAGCSLSASMYRNLSHRFSIGTYGRWDNFEGSAFENSPLVKEKNNFTIGFAVTWRMMFSKQKARYKTTF